MACSSSFTVFLTTPCRPLIPATRILKTKNKKVKFRSSGGLWRLVWTLKTSLVCQGAQSPRSRAGLRGSLSPASVPPPPQNSLSNETKGRAGDPVHGLIRSPPPKFYLGFPVHLQRVAAEWNNEKQKEGTQSKKERRARSRSVYGGATVRDKENSKIIQPPPRITHIQTNKTHTNTEGGLSCCSQASDNNVSFLPSEGPFLLNE